MSTEVSRVIAIGALIAGIGLATAVDAASGRGLKVPIKASDARDAKVTEEVELYSKSYALVVGNDDYSAGWPRLGQAVNDARRIVVALEAQGFEVTLKTNLDARAMRQTFEDFFIEKGSDPDARLFIWFAGHGHTDVKGEGYLIPVDGALEKNRSRFLRTALSLRRFGEFVRLAESKHVFTIFDSCFAGTIFNVARAAPPPQITRITTQPVRQFLTSGDAGQQVSDDGTFAKLFVEALRGERRADSNGDGFLTASELGAFLDGKMSNYTKNRQTPRFGKLRSPEFDKGDFVFALPARSTKATAAKSASATTERSPAPSGGVTPDERVWRVIQSSTDPDIFQTFIENFRDSPFIAFAKAKLKKLGSSKKVASAPPPKRSVPKKSKPAKSYRTDVKDPKAQFDLAYKYEWGQGVPRDPEQAVHWYRKAADQGLAKAQANLAIMYRNGRGVPKSDEKAVYWLRKAADQGLARGQNSLGWMYEVGRGVPKDKPKAVEYYRKAADQGLASAQTNLAFMHEKGLGTPKNYERAVWWYRKAADKGWQRAQTNLATMYRDGLGVEKSDDEAVRWLRKAADQKYRSAQSSLGWMYEVGRGVPKDKAKAVELYRKAAEQGLASAQTNLAWMYEKGRGTATDHGKALSWYRKAADQGHKRAQTNLGFMYEMGTGTPKDYKKAVSWYRKAADRGYKRAISYLGVMYRDGHGVPVDDQEAVRLFRKAGDMGYAEGHNHLGWMYEVGRGVPKDKKMAVKYYRMAADTGHKSAQTNLGYMYAKGRGVPKNIETAVSWYKKAAAQGHQRAKDLLKKLGR